MPRKQKRMEGNATIDVALVVLKTGALESGTDFALDTANKVNVATQTETQEGVKHIKNGVLLAQKLPTTTVTGTQITLSDTLFTPELLKIVQGGELVGSGDELTYHPPVAGSGEKGEIFELECYSAIYDASGAITKYEKITYPNCQGSPVAINTEDNVFRVSEYTINSAPHKGQPPYNLSYVKQLPVIAEAMAVTMEDETGIAVK